MGSSLIALLGQFPELGLHAAVVEPGSPLTGLEVEGAAGVRYSSSLASALAGARLVIDFSSAASALAHVTACAEAGVPLLLGTTGVDGHAIEAAVAMAAARIPVLLASNTSLGVTLLTELVRRAAATLPAGFDIEIIEAHHRHKVDAPSGTALTLAQAAAAGRGQDLQGHGVYTRQGDCGPRAEGRDRLRRRARWRRGRRARGAVPRGR